MHAHGRFRSPGIHHDCLRYVHEHSISRDCTEWKIVRFALIDNSLR
jgi:hypothetical protein